MKIPVFALLISASLLSVSLLKAQTPNATMPVDPDTKLITYKEVVTTTGKPADLYIRAIAWVNKQYKNPADATKVRDPETGLIEITHRFEITQVEKGTTRLLRNRIPGRSQYDRLLLLRKDSSHSGIIHLLNIAKVFKQRLSCCIVICCSRIFVIEYVAC